MKYWVYGGLVLGLVPIQATILDHVSIGSVRPDLCLVAAVIIGLLRGPFEGLLMGGLLGFIQDFFSAGQLGVNLILKGVAGVAVGLSSRYVANATAVTAFIFAMGLSVFSGFVFLGTTGGGEPLVWSLQKMWFIFIVQALYDGFLAWGIFYLFGGSAHKQPGPGFARVLP